MRLAVAGFGNVGLIREAPTDVFVELTFTDLHTGQPATRHIEPAISDVARVGLG